MKKVKMIVSAALVFAVVGSALAFKPHTLNGSLYCRALASGTGACPTDQKFSVNSNGTGTDMYCRPTGDTGDCATQTNVDSNQ